MRGEAALAGAPIGPALEQVRARERDDEDRDAAAPLHQVVDEVEQPGVGVVEVLEDHDHRRRRARAARRRCATRANSWSGAGARLEAKQREQRGLDPAPLLGSGTCSATMSAIFARVVASSSVSSRPARPRIISPSAQKLIPSP